MMEKICLVSPAKINLRLEILKKRSDGYHEVRTLLQKISCYDTLRVALTKRRGIFITSNNPNLPTGRDNLVYRAVESLLKTTDYGGGVRVFIRKRIPLGAGLGGGSSDAATALKAVALLLGLDLPMEALQGIGKKIGADVPFFLFEGAALASGIGDCLKRVDLPELWLVLIYPNFEVSTRWAYEHFVLTRKGLRLNIRMVAKTPEGMVRVLRNDLEGVVSRRYPQIDAMKEMLCSAGALGALMSGSGPTVFGVFENERAAMRAYRELRIPCQMKGWTVFKAHSVP